MTKEQIIQRFDAECDKHPKNKTLRILCEHMIDFLHEHEGAAERIGDNKTLAGAYKRMESEARKGAVDGCGVLTDEEGFGYVHEYFGIGDIEDTTPYPPKETKKPAHRAKSLFELG